jgi:hypothetical protein
LKQNAAGKWVFKATDGSGSSMECVLASQLGRSVESGELSLKNGDVMRVTGYTCNLINEAHKLIISSLEVAAASDAGTARDQAGAAPGTPGSNGDAAMHDAAAPAPQQQTPAAAKAPFGTPGPTPSPSEE